MSNRRKRKKARRKEQRQERKVRQAELVRQQQLEFSEGEHDPENVYQFDEWDDFDPDHEEQIRKDRELKDRRAKKQAEHDEYLAA